MDWIEMFVTESHGRQVWPRMVLDTNPWYEKPKRSFWQPENQVAELSKKYSGSKKMRQKLYASYRPLAHLFQKFKRQNVSDRLANGRTTSFHHGQTCFAVLISNSRFLLLITGRWYTPNSFREWLLVWCERVKTQDKLGERSISTIRLFNDDELFLGYLSSSPWKFSVSSLVKVFF